MTANNEKHADEMILEWILSHTAVAKALYFAWSAVKNEIKQEDQTPEVKINEVEDNMSRILVKVFSDLIIKHKQELAKYTVNLQFNGECKIYNIHTYDQVTKEKKPTTKWRLILKDLRTNEASFPQNFELQALEIKEPCKRN